MSQYTALLIKEKIPEMNEALKPYKSYIPENIPYTILRYGFDNVVGYFIMAEDPSDEDNLFIDIDCHLNKFSGAKLGQLLDILKNPSIEPHIKRAYMDLPF